MKAVSTMVALAALVFAAEAGAAKLNVLLIVADDLRDTVGCYGNAEVKTPKIDRLAARGVRFDRSYVQYPVCNPSRTSFLTGLRCEQTKVVDNNVMFRDVLPEVVTLPQFLRGQGWYAAAYGKIYHLGGGSPAERQRWMDLPRSWDEAKAFQATPEGRVIEGRNLTGGVLKWCAWGATAGGDDDQPDGQSALHAVRAIEQQHAAGRPWIIGAGFHRPHDPFLAPKKYFDLYPAGSMRVYRDPSGITPAPPMALGGEGFRKAFDAFTDQERQEFQRAYYAGVSFMDAQVGRVLDTLDRLNLWDRTLVIFISDNGYHHNERHWWNKNTLFERSCRVPMILAAPGAAAGGVCRSLVELVDLYPTVADYCGLKPPHALAGRSLRPQLENPAAPGRTAAYTLVSRGAGRYGQAVRTDRWRYIQWTDGACELYDETNDREETHDLSRHPAHAATVESMKALLAAVGPFEPLKNAPASPRKPGR